MTEIYNIVHSGNFTYWDYLDADLQDLFREGGFLYAQIFEDSKYLFSDYSFLVFPFAKAYEGFIKKLLLDLKLLSKESFYSNHLRVGKILSPDLIPREGEELIYSKISHDYGKEMAEQIWLTWKYCRNKIFHYYPNNNQKITLSEAKERIDQIVFTMKACCSLFVPIIRK